MNHPIDALKATMVILLVLIWGAVIICAPLLCVLVAVGLGIVIVARANARAMKLERKRNQCRIDLS